MFWEKIGENGGEMFKKVLKKFLENDAHVSEMKNEVSKNKKK